MRNVVPVSRWVLRSQLHRKQCHRGGSRVVQVISRNPSNVSKPAFIISQVLYCSSRNHLSFLFYCLLWNKTNKKASHLVIPSITRVGLDATSFPGSARHSKWRPTRHFDRWEDLLTRDEVGTGWYMNLVTNHSKPTSIGQDHSHCLANYSKSVVIGYPGRKLPWKLLTIVCKGKPLPRSPFVCSVWAPS